MTSRSPELSLAGRSNAGALRRMLCKFDVKTAAGSPDEKMTFSGYGAVFDNVDSYGDAIAKGAFKASLRESKKSGVWPSMLSQHGGWGLTSTDLTPVGVYDALDEDDIGLKLSGILAPTPRGIELHVLMTMKPRPAIDGLSIGYIPRKWKINGTPKDGEARRTLTEIDLMEISPVTFPANTRARVTDAKMRPGSVREFESAFRDVFGLSSREAKRAAGAAWRALERRESETSTEISELLKSAARSFSNQR